MEAKLEVCSNNKETLCGPNYPTPPHTLATNSVTARGTKRAECTEHTEGTEEPCKKKAFIKSPQSNPHKEFKSKESNPVPSFPPKTPIENNNGSLDNIIFEDFLNTDFELYSGSSSPELSDYAGMDMFAPLNLISPTTSDDNFNQGEYTDQLFDSTTSQRGYSKDDSLNAEISDISNGYSIKHVNNNPTSYTLN